MKMKFEKGTKLHEFVAKQLAASSLSQREIAEAVGYKNQNMITMIKQGNSKLALDRVPAMARVLNVDPRHLFRLALEQSYSQQAATDLMMVLDSSLSDNERKLVEIYREATGGMNPPITPEIKAQIQSAFAEK
jgi:transcriptional regulator with XRE-family HTH domain